MKLKEVSLCSTEKSKKSNVNIQTNPEHIIVFSSNFNFMKSTCNILSEHGYTTSGFTSIEDTLNSLEGLSADILLIDVEKGDYLKIDILQNFLKIKRALLCIIVLEQGESQLAIEAIKKGAFDYLFKPFKIEMLLMIVNKATEFNRLRKDRDFYYSIFKDAVEGIYIRMPHGKYSMVNPSLVNILGYRDCGELIGKLNDMPDQIYVEPGRYNKIIHLLHRKDFVTGFESQVYRKDGSVIWISESVSAVRDDKGNVTYYRGAIEDITRKKQNEEKLVQSESYFRLCAEKSEKNTAIFLDMIDEICESYKELDGLFIKFVKTSVNLLDKKNKWTKGHSERVAKYAELLGKEIGLDGEELKKLKLAALLHDIGRIGTFEHLVDKSSKFTKEEYELVRRHPIIGAELLEKMGFFSEVVYSVKHHHERIDGKGYPDGLKGKNIPLYSRILHIADSFDSMTAERPHRAGFGKDYAFSELKKCRGSQFDPDIVKVALKIF